MCYEQMARNEGCFAERNKYPSFSCVGCLRDKTTGILVGTAFLIKNPFVKDEQEHGSQWILTDAHVLDDEELIIDNLEFLLCENLLDETTIKGKSELEKIEFFVPKETFHTYGPLEEKFPFQYPDIALLKLKKPILWYEKEIEPADLGLMTESFLKRVLGHKLFISGFGYTGNAKTHTRFYSPKKRSAETVAHQYVVPFGKNIGYLTCTFLNPDGGINLSRVPFNEMSFTEQVCHGTVIQGFQLKMNDKIVLQGESSFSNNGDPFVVSEQAADVDIMKLDFLLNKNNVSIVRKDCLEYEGSIMGGDSGGPLFYQKQDKWECIGLALAGVPPCTVYGSYQFFTPLTQEVWNWIKKVTLEE